ncbi:hypothetical protein HG530_003449 [Fusarium avenaceum]|nr:hypothetical protein HG530_003449 [Fusarium avenaceum]
MDELCGGIKIVEVLILVASDDICNCIVGGLFVKQTTEDVLGDLFVFLVTRIRHFLNRKENLGEAPHDRSQLCPVLHFKRLVKGLVESNKHLLVQNTSNKVEAGDIFASILACLFSCFASRTLCF